MLISYETHPSVGIARLGDSSTGYFLLEESLAQTLPSYRSPDGRLMRQAARFQVFRCERDESGRLLRAVEVSGADAEIEWTIHVANRKGVARLSTRAGRRNDATGDDSADRDLIIDAGPQSISVPDGRCLLDAGSFKGQQVYLGEAWANPDGSLTVLGGRGIAACSSANGATDGLSHFADNDCWYDDVSDGPVSARLRLTDGTTVEARAAWLLSVPPDYAPGITSVVTLHDVATDAAIARNWAGIPEMPSFRDDIYPILLRLVEHQWVNDVFRRDYGPGGKWDFAAALPELSDPESDVRLRQDFFSALRGPFGTVKNPKLMEPRLRSASEEFAVLALSYRQYMCLHSWASGRFVGDLSADPREEMRPEYLDRINLVSCIGGSLRPGLEVSEAIRDPKIYLAPYCLDPNLLRPGQLTESTAVPWQGDFYSCRFDGSVAWWPSHRPDHVYRDREAALAGTSVKWARGVASPTEMLTKWSELGILKPSPEPLGPGAHIESERTLG